MAKFFNCVSRLQAAAGRHLSDTEVQDIFERVHKAALDMKAGRIAPGQSVSTKYGGSIDNVITDAAAEAARQYIADAALKERRAAAQVVKLSQRLDDVKAMKNAGLSDLDSISRTIANRADGRSNAFSLESRFLGIATDMKRRIQDTWLGLGDDFLGFVQDSEKIRLLLREMKGENTGDALAKRGAKAWLGMAEEFRTRFNAAGGDIGKLDDWALPQHHSQELVARAGKDAWVNAVLPALDRSRYVDDAGTPMNDVQVRRFLEKAWKTIATDGYNKVEPGQFRGKGGVANRGSAERQIHFQNADAYLNYWAQFGDKTFPDILMGHVEHMAQNIALLEHFGPNPEATYRTMRDAALQAQVAAEPLKIKGLESQAAKLDGLWDVANGRINAGKFDPSTPWLRAGLAVLRDLNVAGKLGSAFWASFYGDKVALEAVSRVNKLPAFQNWWNELRMLNPANSGERALLQKQGLMLEYMNGAMSRFGEDFGQSRWSGKLAQSVMRVSGMNAINEWRRGAFGLSMMSTLGEMVRSQDFAAAVDSDMHLLKSFGVTEHDWNLWKLAQPADLGHGNTQSLTADAIMRIPDDALKATNLIAQTATPKEAQAMRTEAATKFLGVLSSESRYAIVEPGWRERAQMQNLTGSGPLARAFWQFKSFPLAQFERMWDIAMSRPSFGGKAGTLGMIMVMQTLAGAMIMQTRDLLAGKDPRPMDDWKFWLAAFMQGGTLGIYGDFLYGASQTRYGTGPLEIAAGPTAGAALDFLTSSMQAARAQTEGRDTHLLPHYMNIAKGFVPANNLWYTKAALDHIFFQNAQEALSPGYLASVRSRSMKEYGQSWWWEPGEFTPGRAPELGTALGH